MYKVHGFLAGAGLAFALGLQFSISNGASFLLGFSLSSFGFVLGAMADRAGSRA